MRYSHRYDTRTRDSVHLQYFFLINNNQRNNQKRMFYVTTYVPTLPTVYYLIEVLSRAFTSIVK